MSIERRRAPRINLLKPVPGRVGPEEQPIEVRQMSVGGMLIETATQLSPLGLHEFALALDDRTVAHVRGQIVHSRYSVEGDSVTYTFGVAFAALPEDTDEQVRRFVVALQETAGPSGPRAELRPPDLRLRLTEEPRPMQKAAARPWKRILATCVVVGAAAVSSACELAFSHLSAEAREEWTKTFELAANGRVEIANANGTIEVEPSRDGKVHVRAERIAKGGTEEGAREVLKRVEIKDTVEPGLVRLETKTPPGGLFSSGHARVDYYVEVPGTASVRIGNTNGRISVRQIAGRVEAETTNGGVEGRGLSGAVKATTTNGGVDVELAALHQDGVTLETVNGGVRLALPDSAKADISATTVNGGISTSGLSVDSTESSRRRLDGRINGGGARIRIDVTNGGVRIEGRSGS